MPQFQRELWSIFTHYNLQGGGKEPGQMKFSQFLTLCKDCHLVTPTTTPAELTVLFATAAARRPAGPLSTNKLRALGAKALVYSDFLDLLRQVGLRVYPDLADRPTDCFRRLLLENVLPFAARRAAIDISRCWTPKVTRLLGVMVDDEVRGVVVDRPGKLTKSLRQIFSWYCHKYNRRIVSEDTQRKRALPKPKGGIAPSRLRPRQTNVSNPEYAGFAEMMRFFEDYAMFSSDAGSALLSTVQAMNIYLASTPPHKDADNDSVPDLSEGNFFSMLMRVAFVAFPDEGPNAFGGEAGPLSPEIKLKALMLHMWKAICHPTTVHNMLAQDRGTNYDAVNSKGGDLNIWGSAMFNTVFQKMWRADDFIDYAQTEGEALPPDADRPGGGGGDQANGTAADDMRATLASPVGGSKVQSAWVESPDMGGGSGGGSSERIVLRTSDLRQLFESDSTLAEYLANELHDLDHDEGPVVGWTRGSRAGRGATTAL